MFAVKICCTQTPGARPFVLLQLAPTPINGKAQRLVAWWLDGHLEHRWENSLCTIAAPEWSQWPGSWPWWRHTAFFPNNHQHCHQYWCIGHQTKPPAPHCSCQCQRWQLLIITPEVDEQSHKLWILPSLWKRDWVCALLAPSTLSWVRFVHCARQTVRATKNGERSCRRGKKRPRRESSTPLDSVGRATRRHNSARKGLLKNLTLWLDRSQSLFYFVPQEKNITVKLATEMDLSWVPEMTSRVITCSSIFIFNSLCNQICYLWDQTPMAKHLTKLRSDDKDPICDGLNCHLSSASDD